MNTLLWWLGQNTITVAIMIPFVLVACRLFRDRPAAQHLLWVIVLVKFVTPPIVSWPWSVEQVRESIWSSTPTPETETAGVLIEQSSPVEVIEGRAAILDVDPEGIAGILPREVDSQPTKPGAEPVGNNWTRLDAMQFALWTASGIWILGAGACGIWQLRRIARHVSLVRQGTAAPDQLTAEVRGIARQFGLRPPRALIAQRIVSPFIWCLGRLRLIWPDTLTGRAEVIRSRGIIAHELAHIRRGDHWVSWLELASGIVWWWNPLYWFTRRRLRESAEMACDALAIGAGSGQRREYAKLLLELSSGCKSGTPAPALAVSAGTPSSFERRLTMILSDRVSGKASSWGILTAICLALVSIPGWSLGQQKDLPKAQSVADDAILRDLIEQGKFAEAKARLEALRVKQAADKAVADGVFPEKWKEALIKELPAACIKGIPKNAALSWKICMSCHATLKETDKPRFVDEMKRLEAFRLDSINQALGVPFDRVLTSQDLRPLTPVDFAQYQLLREQGHAPLFFKGNGRTYYLIADDKGAQLRALNADGREMWRGAISAKPPVAKGGGEWHLAEPTDKKIVVLSWKRDTDCESFHFETNSGKLMRQETTSALPSEWRFQKATPVPTSEWRGKRVPPTTELDKARLERLEAEVQELRQKIRRQGNAAPQAQSPDGKLLAVVNGDKDVMILDSATGQILFKVELDGTTKIVGHSFSADGKTLVVQSAKELWEVDAATGKVLRKTPPLDRKSWEPKTGKAIVPLEPFPAPTGSGTGATDRESKTRLEGITRDPLDLAERYLQAVADLKLARSRLAGLKKGSGVDSQFDVEKAEIEMERAQKLEQLLAAYLKDAVKLAAAAQAAAEQDVRRICQLLDKGFVAQSEVDAVQARYLNAAAQLKQLESILSLAGPAQ